MLTADVWPRRAALVAVWLWSCLTTGTLAEERFSQDFRRGQPLHPMFGTLGPRDPACMQEESGGLRLEFPKNGPFLPVGVSLKLAVKGDFEFNATYAVVAAEGNGCTIGVGVTFPAGSGRRCSFEIPLKSDAEATGASANGQRAPKPSKPAPRPQEVMRVRLVRAGERVTFQHGPANGPLTDVDMREGFSGDAHAIYFGFFNTDGRPGRLRLQDFSVSGADLEAVRVAPHHARRSWTWLWWTAAALGIGWLLLRRYKRRPADEPVSLR